MARCGIFVNTDPMTNNSQLKYVQSKHTTIKFTAVFRGKPTGLSLLVHGLAGICLKDSCCISSGVFDSLRLIFCSIKQHIHVSSLKVWYKKKLHEKDCHLLPHTFNKSYLQENFRPAHEQLPNTFGVGIPSDDDSCSQKGMQVGHLTPSLMNASNLWWLSTLSPMTLNRIRGEEILCIIFSL